MDAIETVKSEYIRELLGKGIREDKRGSNDYRKISVSTGVMGNAEGSAQVDLGCTRVLAGVKLVLGEPMEDTPNQGNLVVSAELLPLANPEYETGPPSPDAIELARVTDRGIRAGNCVNLDSLFVEEGKVWSVYVDVYVLNYDGNLFDACEIAAMAALSSATVPKYADGNIDREDRSTRLKIDNTVTSCTFAKIGKDIILDPNGSESGAADARISIAVDKDSIRAMQKGGSGGFTAEEVESLVDVAFNKHKELKDMIDKDSGK